MIEPAVRKGAWSPWCSGDRLRGKTPPKRWPRRRRAGGGGGPGAGARSPVTLLPAADGAPVPDGHRVGGLGRSAAGERREAGGVGGADPDDPAACATCCCRKRAFRPRWRPTSNLASPCGAAVVALDDKGRSGVVLAIPARGPGRGRKLIAALGKPVMTSGPLTKLADATGKSQGWVYRAGTVVVMGDEVDAMARGTMLALEARHQAPTTPPRRSIRRRSPARTGPTSRAPSRVPRADAPDEAAQSARPRRSTSG